MDTKEEHIIALKVMRLTRPTLYSNPVVSCDPRDLPGATLTSAPDVTRLPDLPDLQLGEMLLLPQSFGSIYLGETFSCYLSVHNHSSEPASDVTVRAELQTGSQRLTLTPGPGGVERPVTLPPAASRDHVIHHEVKDTGAHILVCAINYISEAGVSKFFRKFFKFEVLKPLDVKTKFYNAESDEVYLEAQIQNVTPAAMCMEGVSLEPSPLFDATDLNGVSGGESSFGASGWLGPQDSRQYLFCLAPRPELRAASKQLKGVTNIGKLDITWRTNLGERGRLQTSQLQRMTPGYGDLRLTIEDMPSVVELEETFHFTCRVQNASDRSLALSLRLEPPAGEPGLVWRGVSGRQLGQLAPGATAPVTLQMVARRLGLQTISGVRLLDAGLNRPYDYDNLAQVFVRRLCPV
ncbi:trafficking protein particle complex subunit 13-like isoform X2 [Pollicipes pollicipes]|uniref:trafficking protein particle complex subunit 13-like isoform X2 n=1 Tax=Pollicipes pollicipes TaxID=41117 RepID=UPI0018857428|nr:trafficking protein particle complex subunit 13-like isoform X2 [Pollicipes pollicipes]